MTEIPDLGMLFGQQRASRMSAAQQAEHDRYRDAVREADAELYRSVQFFAPLLCSCTRRYDREDPAPPQAGCLIHGHLRADAEGNIMMPGQLP